MIFRFRDLSQQDNLAIESRLPESTKRGASGTDHLSKLQSDQLTTNNTKKHSLSRSFILNRKNQHNRNSFSSKMKAATENNKPGHGEDLFLAMLHASTTPTSPKKPTVQKNLERFDPLLTPTRQSAAGTESTINQHRISSPEVVVPSLNNGREEFANTNKVENPFLQAVNVENNFQSTVSPGPNVPPIAPLTPTPASKPPAGKARGHRKTQSLTGVFITSTKNRRRKSSLSPPKYESQPPPAPTTTPEVAAPPPAAAQSPSVTARLLNWSKRGKGHRKTLSVMAVPTVSPPTPPRQPQSLSASNSPARGDPIRSISASIDELLKLDLGQNETTNQHPLSIPSLAAKPRPTSFLTGKEGVLRSSEQQPAPWQLELPGYVDVLTTMHLCQFIESYATDECLLDLQLLIGHNNLELSRFARGDDKLITNDVKVADIHRSVVEQLLDCGKDISEVKGFFSTSKHDEPDNRREVLVIERQNKFVCIFRGTKHEQQGKYSKQPETVALQDGSTANVYTDRYKAFAELQGPTFDLLDKLAEENPFCDIMFTGHSYGASMATLAAYTYAVTRTSLRVGCCVGSCPKVGPEDFRWAVHSTPNLNMCRLEYGKYRHGHVGHSIRLSQNKEGPVAAVFKFGIDSHNQPGGAAVFSLLSGGIAKDKSIHEYISLLEDMNSNKWPKDFYNEDGVGVRGKDNEAREMS